MNDYVGSLEANLVNIPERRIDAVAIEWQQGSISSLQPLGPAGPNPALPYLLPGFVDAHVHIESSMLPPSEFGRIAVRHGTVASVSDPHEIANVLGLEGMRFMLDDARDGPFHILFGAPCCVPATTFETAGASFDPGTIEALLDTPGIGYLSEMMNVPGVLGRDPTVMAMIAAAQARGLPVDGHAPGLSGRDAARYAGAGISTDHECSTLAEAQAKLDSGMFILIREGSAARNFDALHPLIDECPERLMFCSDDKHPDDLVAGHIDRMVAAAVAAGHDVFDVLRIACLNPVDHYRLGLGRLRVGDTMDAVLVADLQAFTPLKTWIGGRLVAERGASLLPQRRVQALNRFDARPITADDLRIPDRGQNLRVIGVLDGQLLTEERIVTPTVRDGLITPDPDRDLLPILVLNRYRPEPPALGYIQGFGLRHGAIASSVAHDSHNIVAVGADIDALVAVVNALVEQQGGIAVSDGNIREVMPLPLAGLMSDRDGDWVAQRYHHLDQRAREFGSDLAAPFMTLSFMALLVIPDLKLSDRGLFDGRRFQFTDLLTDDDPIPAQ